MSDNKQDQLNEINATLATHSLKPLAALGDHTRGKIELVEIIEIFDHSKRFFTDVQFRCLFPGGAEGRYTIRWNANSAVSDGAVMLVIVNGRLAIVRQYRPALGTFLDELPRGFGEEFDRAQVHGRLGTMTFGDLPLATALRELGEEVLEGATVESVTHLGNIAENSSTHTATPAYWLIEVTVAEVALKQRLSNITADEGIALKLWTYQEALRNIGTRLLDAHSIVGMALLGKRLAGLAAL